jgi:hypothetical protein
MHQTLTFVHADRSAYATLLWLPKRSAQLRV